MTELEIQHGLIQEQRNRITRLEEEFNAQFLEMQELKKELKHQQWNDTLDQFAMAALTGLLAGPYNDGDRDDDDFKQWAECAYTHAQAMINEREKWSK